MAFLEARDLRLHYQTDRGTVRAVDGVSFSVEAPGESLGIIGETGSGKTSLLYSLSRIYPRNVSHASGNLVLNGNDLSSYPEQRFRREVRWKEIAIVFQAAMNGFNPVLRVGPQIVERALAENARGGSTTAAGAPGAGSGAVAAGDGTSGAGSGARAAAGDGAAGAGKRRGAELRRRAEDLLEGVGLPRSTYDRYPHELSGGMKQRAAIAMALIMDPSLLILDEPTSALDVSVQAQIMNTLKRLKWERNLGMIFITHDIALASDLCDRIVVMYAGQVREEGTAEQVLGDPQDPYTRELLASIPRLSGGERPRYVGGVSPDPISPPQGCRFHTRCPLAFDRCAVEPPPLVPTGQGHAARCWLAGNGEPAREGSP